MLAHFQASCAEGTFFTCSDSDNLLLTPLSYRLSPLKKQVQGLSSVAAAAPEGEDCLPSLAEDVASDVAWRRFRFDSLQESCGEGSGSGSGLGIDLTDAVAAPAFRITQSQREAEQGSRQPSHCSPVPVLQHMKNSTPELELCFGIVKSNPKRQKRVRVSETVIQGFETRDVLVSAHSVSLRETSCPEKGLQVDLSPLRLGENDDFAAALTFPQVTSMSQVELLGDIWQTGDTGMSLSVPMLQGIKHQECVQALLQRFLNQLAVSGSDSVLSMSRDDDEYAENVACLERTQALHVVECVQQLTDATSWVLLSEWLSRLDVTSALKQPRPLFHHDHGDALPYLEWTDLRLMHFLHCHGWQMVPTCLSNVGFRG